MGSFVTGETEYIFFRVNPYLLETGSEFLYSLHALGEFSVILKISGAPTVCQGMCRDTKVSKPSGADWHFKDRQEEAYCG